MAFYTPNSAQQSVIRSFFWASLFLFLAAVVWVAYLGFQLTLTGKNVSPESVKLAGFADFAKSFRLTAPASAPIGLGASAGSDLAEKATLQQIFEWVADFENNRASDRLKKIKPVISGVVSAGLAERIGIRAGDEIVTVNGSAVGSVYDVYETFDQRAEQVAKLTIRRQGRLFSANLAAPAGSVIDAGSSGLLFNVPRGLNIVTRRQAGALAAQFDAQFLQPVPAEWRSLYQRNLARMMLELQPYVESQRDLTSNDPGFIRIEEVLSWHDEAFVKAMNQHAEAIRKEGALQMQLLSSLGDAAIGLVAALSLFLMAFWMRFRVTPRAAEGV